MRGIWLIVSVALFGGASSKAIFQIEDMLKVNQIYQVQASSDGKQLLYTLTNGVESQGGGRWIREVRIVDQDGSNDRLLIDRKLEPLQPLFDPLGKGVYFLSDKKGKAELWFTSLDGKDPKVIGRVNHPIISYKIAKNGKMAAVVAQVPLEGKESAPTEFRQDRFQNQLFALALEDGIGAGFWQLSEKGDYLTDMAAENFAISDDGTMVAYTAFPSSQIPDFDQAKLKLAYVYDGPVELLSALCCIGPRFSPNGGRVAAIQIDSKAKYADNGRVIVINTKTKKYKALKETPNGSFSAPNAILGWSLDGKQIYFVDAEKGGNALFTLSTDGDNLTKIDLPLDDLQIFTEPTLTGNQLAFSLSSPKMPSEAAFFDLEENKIHPLTHHNKDIPSSLIPEVRRIEYPSFDKTTIEGLLIYPSNYKKGQSYPVVIFLHGGPFDRALQTFIGNPSIVPFLTLANEGYFVFQPDYRGSNGYGKAFRSALFGKAGTDDVQDIFYAIDRLKSRGCDPKRVTLAGYSYGSYLGLNLLIRYPKLFSFALFGSGIYSPFMFSINSDVYDIFDFLLEPETKMNPSFYDAKLGQLSKIETPILLEHGRQDTTSLPDQSMMLYQLLVKQDKRAKLLIFDQVDHHIWSPKSVRQAAMANFQFIQEKAH